MKKQTFLGGVLILFLAGIVAKILGAVYRIPLTWILGSQGLGIYQLVFPIFSLLMVLSSAGMPTAISKMVANSLSQNDQKSAKKIFKISLILLGGVGLLFGVILALISSWLAGIQQNEQSVYCYIAIAPALFFVSVLSCFRGYFQGHQNMVPTAVSQIIEQLGKLVLGLLLSYLLMDYGVEFGALGAILGVTISEILAVLVLGIMYAKHRKTSNNYSQNELQSTMHSTVLLQNEASVNNLARAENNIASREDNKNFGYKTNKQIVKNLIKTALPIVLATVTLPLLSFVESLLVINLLQNANIGVIEGTKLWGINTGVVNSLVNMPIVLSLSVAISIVPVVAGTSSRQEITEKFNQAINLVLIFCLPVTLGFLMLGEPLVSLLYQNSLGGAGYLMLATQMLAVSCTNIVFGAILQVQNSTLQAIGKGSITMYNMFLSGLVKIALFVWFIQNPIINIWGSVISTVVFYMLAFVLNAIYIRYKLKIKLHFKSVLPSVAGVLLMALFIGNLMLGFEQNLGLLAIQIIGGGILYVFALFVFGAFSKFNLKEIILKIRKKNL